MPVSALSQPDPYILDDTIARVYVDTRGLSFRNTAINPSLKTLVLIAAGQSLLCNVCPSVYIATNDSKIDNFNIYDGAIYSLGVNASSGLLGVTGYFPQTDLGAGNILPRVADKFITNGIFDRVILVPIAIGGTFVSDWSVGHLKDRFAVTMRRLAARGITPATTGATFAHYWGQGPSDGVVGTSQATYQSSWGTYYSNALAAGFSGRTFVELETYFAGTTYSTIRAAQTALVNGTTIFQGGDTDTLNGANRGTDLTHWSDTGAAAGATLIYNAMHATGAPF